MENEISRVICTRSDCQKLFIVGKIYEVVDNIPINREETFTYTWNNHIRNINKNLAKFKKYDNKRIYYRYENLDFDVTTKNSR